MPHRADRYIKAGKSAQKVGADLMDILVKRQGPEIDAKVEAPWKFRLAEELNEIIWNAQLVHESYKLVTSPDGRKQLCSVIDKGGPTTEYEQWLWLAARQLYRLVYRDQLDGTGKQPRDIDDYIRSKAWIQKFKGAKGGPTRKVAVERCAIDLAWCFERYTGSPCWRRVGEIIAEAFPDSLQRPKITTINTRTREYSQLPVNYRLGRWAKESAKRYARWAQQFRPKQQ